MKKNKTAFITGITGFAGSHLAELLLKKGYKVHGLCRWRSRTENIEGIKRKIHLLEGDLLDTHSLQEAMMKVRPNLVFHLAAQSFVPASWVSPVVTLKINVVGSCNLFEAIRAAQIDPVIQIACCYDKETCALTTEGLKNFKEIKKGDLVLSINLKTKEISLKPVLKVIIDNYKGEMIHVKGKRVDLMITPNHRCYFEDKSEGLKSVYADDLSGDYQLPRGKSKGKHPLRIKGFSAEDLLYLLGLYIGDGYGDANKRMFVTKTGLSRSEYLKHCRDNQGRFKKMPKKSGTGFSVTHRVFLAIPRNGKARKSAEQCLKNLKIKFSGYDNCLYFSSEPLLRILKTAGENAGSKHIPRWAFDYSPGFLKKLYKGIIDSDGSRRKGRESLTTVSFRLVETFLEVCTRLGFTCTYRFLKPRKTLLKNRFIRTNPKGIYTVSVSHRPKQVRSSLNVYKEHYEGKIWCVEVADNHTLLVSRNGKADFCGNSSEEYGLFKPDEVPIRESNPLRPLSPYAVSKAAMDYLGYQYFKSYQMKIVRTRGFNHSIKGEMPVLVKEARSGLIDILPIRDIRKKREKNSDEIWNVPQYEIWDGEKFTKIINMSAHFLRGDKKIHTINVVGGVIKCTSNHSLLNDKLKELEAKQVKKGDKLAVGEYPKPTRQLKVNKDIAWFLGALCADGCTKEERKVEFANKDLDFIKEVEAIFLKNFTGYTTVHNDRSGVMKLSFNGNSWLTKFVRDSIYTKDKEKKVPKLVLNSNKEAQKAFLDGFNKGDGFKGNSYSPKRKHKQYSAKSPTLAMGLCYLIENALATTYSISYEDRNEGYYHMYIRSRDKRDWGSHFKKQQNLVTKNITKKKNERVAVYDFETESHHFMSGAGKIIVHNTGPRRGDVFVCSSFAKQIAEIEKGKKEPVMKVGNLSAKRDFTDVRDMVNGYFLATQKGKIGEVYNICSGKAIEINKILKMLLAMSKVKVEVEQDPARMRPSDVPVLQGSCSKFRRQTGWKPKIPFERTLKDLLNYWRERV